MIRVNFVVVLIIADLAVLNLSAITSSETDFAVLIEFIEAGVVSELDACLGFTLALLRLPSCSLLAL